MRGATGAQGLWNVLGGGKCCIRGIGKTRRHHKSGAKKEERSKKSPRCQQVSDCFGSGTSEVSGGRDEAPDNLDGLHMEQCPQSVTVRWIDVYLKDTQSCSPKRDGCYYSQGVTGTGRE